MLSSNLGCGLLYKQVNTDLKKLLVASVGDDLHWKMDALVRLVFWGSLRKPSDALVTLHCTLVVTRDWML